MAWQRIAWCLFQRERTGAGLVSFPFLCSFTVAVYPELHSGIDATNHCIQTQEG